MYRSGLASSLILATVFCNCSLAIPLDPAPNLDIPRQANSSNQNVPPQFKVDLSQDTNRPINPEEIYRAAIDMMFRVSDYPLTDTWLSKAFPSPLGNSGIYLTHAGSGKAPSELTTQHIIWGLNHLMLSMLLSRRYCQSVAMLKWEGRSVGYIHVARQTPSLSLAQDSSRHETATPMMTLDNQEDSGGLSHFFDRDVKIQVVYGDKQIDKYLIYLTAIKAMGDAAGTGLDTPVQAVVTIGIQQVTWKLLREVGSQVPELKTGHSRMAVYRTVAKLIHDQRFMEIYVILDIVGDRTAIGGFNQGVSGAATP